MTNPPYGRDVVDAIAEATVARVRSGQVLGAALLMRASWDLRIPHPREWEFTPEDASNIRDRMLAHAESLVATADE